MLGNSAFAPLDQINSPKLQVNAAAGVILHSTSVHKCCSCIFQCTSVNLSLAMHAVMP